MKLPPVYYTKRFKKGFNAVTLPPLGIFISDKERNNEQLLSHELVHWRQYKERGLVKYYRDYNRLLKQYGYDLHPMEIEARFIENDYCQQHYTHCVRTGQAITVHNPNFRNWATAKP